MESLGDSAFAAKTITAKSKDTRPVRNPLSLREDEPNVIKVLDIKEEVICNALWRFLQLRGYVDAKHTLTNWGKILDTTLSSLDPADHHYEAAFLAVELLRLGLLNADPMFPKYTGSPSGGSGE